MLDFDLSKAFDLFEQGEYQQVIDSISPALASLDGNEAVEANFLMGLSLYQKFDFEGAEDVLNKVAIACPCVDVWIWQLENMMCLGKVEESLELALSCFINSKSSHVAAIVVRAARYLGRWNIAKSIIQQVMENDTEDTVFISEALLFQIDCPFGNPALALETLSSLNQANPFDQNVALSFSYALLRRGEKNLVKPVLANVDCLGVAGLFFKIYMAWIIVESDTPEDARELIVELQSSAPLVPLVSLVTGYFYAKQRIFIRSAHAFSSLLNKCEGFVPEIRFVANFLTRHLHNYEMAFKAYSKLIAINAADTNDFMSMAWLAFHNEKYEYLNTIKKELASRLGSSHPDVLALGAIQKCADNDFRELLNIPQNKGESVFYFYAQCIVSTVHLQFDKAEAYAKKALGLFPDDLLLTKALVDVYIKQSRWQDAQLIGEVVLENCPADFQLRSQMLLVALELNDTEKVSLHDSLMFRYSVDEYEEWLWEKIKDDFENPVIASIYIGIAIKALHNFCNHGFDVRAEQLCRNYIEKGPKGSRHIFVKFLLRLLMGLERFEEGGRLLNDESFAENQDVELLKATYYAAIKDYEQAELYANLAFEKSQGYREYDMLAAIYVHIGGHRQRIFDLCDKAVELNPDNKLLKWNTSFYAAFLGDSARYDKYLDVALEIGLRAPCRHFMAPLWKGESLKDKTILIWREQGIGDELAGSMYFQALIDRADREGGRVKIECTDRLESLFRRSFPRAQVDREALDDDMVRTDLDYHIPALSIRKNVDHKFKFPVEYVAHLSPHKELRRKWRERLDALGSGLKIGICWRSGLQSAGRNNFYAEQQDLAPLLALPNVHWVNLNYAGYQQDYQELRELYGVDMHIWDDLDLKNDFEGLAALTSELDLVISAASTPGVLACCLGRPTWMFTFGADHPKVTPTYSYTMNYPALTWLRHYKESYHDVFSQMAARIGTLGVREVVK